MSEGYEVPTELPGSTGLICSSLSHTHYWYEMGMLKVPAVVDMFDTESWMDQPGVYPVKHRMDQPGNKVANQPCS